MEPSKTLAPTLEQNDRSASFLGSSRRGLIRYLSRFREFALVPVLGVMMIVGFFVNDAFLTKTNLLNILQLSSYLSVIVIAESLILLTGRFDLSLESVVGLAPMVAAYLMVTDTSIGGSGIGLNPYLAILVCLAVGLAAGVLNGFFVVKLRLNAFIVTLAILILLRGITIGLTDGRTLFGFPEPFTYLGSASWWGIPVSVWAAGILYLFFGLLLKYHKFGRAIYAVGGNSESARAAGIRVNFVVWAVFALGGLLAGVAGLMLSGLLTSATTAQGQNSIFYVFAAAVIGGISLQGGRGSLIGALCGVLLLGVVSNLLTLSGIATFWINAAYGAIILAALMLAALVGGRASGART